MLTSLWFFKDIFETLLLVLYNFISNIYIWLNRTWVPHRFHLINCLNRSSGPINLYLLNKNLASSYLLLKLQPPIIHLLCLLCTLCHFAFNLCLQLLQISLPCLDLTLKIFLHSPLTSLILLNLVGLKFLDRGLCVKGQGKGDIGCCRIFVVTIWEHRKNQGDLNFGGRRLLIQKRDVLRDVQDGTSY